MEKYMFLKSSSDPSEPLVNKAATMDSDTDEEGDDSYMGTERHNNRFRYILIHVSLLAMNLVICLGVVFWAQSSRSNSMANPRGPLRGAVTHEHHAFDLSSIYRPDGSLNLKRPPFGGPPRKELSDSWSNLTQYMTVSLQPEELGQFRDDDRIIRLTDGSGAFGTLAVYHGIHCVNRLHRYLYQDHYYSDLTEPRELQLLKHHTEHCIDWLRQYIQCNADLTVIPMYWQTNQVLPISLDIGKHQCVNWESLQNWMKERSFDAFEPGLLMHPKFGNPYADHKPNKIGLAEEGPLLKDHPGNAEH